MSVGKCAEATVVIVDFNLIYSTISSSGKCLSSLYRENFFYATKVLLFLLSIFEMFL